MAGKSTITTATQQTAEQISDQVASALADLKPKLRGWLHAVTAPLSLAAGVVLIVLSPTPATRVGSVVFMVTSLMLFTVSAIYHRGTWSPRTWAALQRFDHANIFLLIAGSYTPFALVMLEGRARTTLLAIAWGGALAGVTLRLLWRSAPRWFYTPIYIALGWAAVFYTDDFLASGSTAVFVLIATGGILYTIGGLVFGLQRPNPFPSWFGFHEVFHAFTIAAFITHYVGISLATYSLR